MIATLLPEMLQFVGNGMPSNCCRVAMLHLPAGLVTDFLILAVNPALVTCRRRAHSHPQLQSGCIARRPGSGIHPGNPQLLVSHTLSFLLAVSLVNEDARSWSAMPVPMHAWRPVI